jgi:hypothetical protein
MFMLQGPKIRYLETLIARVQANAILVMSVVTYLHQKHLDLV